MIEREQGYRFVFGEHVRTVIGFVSDLHYDGPDKPKWATLRSCFNSAGELPDGTLVNVQACKVILPLAEMPIEQAFAELRAEAEGPEAAA